MISRENEAINPSSCIRACSVSGELANSTGGVDRHTLIAPALSGIPSDFTLAPSAANANNNLVADNVVTVTFVYFYYENVVPDWENQIRADMTDIEEVYRQCPELKNLGTHFRDFENFVSQYTNLNWEWRFYGEVEIPELAENYCDGYFIACWHDYDPVTAENVWDSSDIIYGIIEGLHGGSSANNLGFAWLGAYLLWEPGAPEVWQRYHQLTPLAHELIHDFGAPDHYKPDQEHYGEDNLCIFGGFYELSDSSILCDFCLERIHWDYLKKVSKQEIFYPFDVPAILTNASVRPLSGGDNTSFTYEVTFLDNDGGAPEYIRVYIDNIPHSMTLVAGDISLGAIYQYSTALTAGSHTYYFEARDGPHMIRYPENGVMSGPTVTEAAEPSNIRKIVMAALAVALISATLVVWKYRKKA